MQCHAQDTSIKGKVSADTIAVGQPFDYQIILTVPENYLVTWATFKDTLSNTIDVLKVGDITTTPAEKGKFVVMKQNLTLTSFENGDVNIPEIGISYLERANDTVHHTLYTDEYDIYVKTIAVDTTKAIMPIKAPIEQSFTFKEGAHWAILFIIVAALVFLIIYLIKHLSGKKKTIVFKKKKVHVIPAIVTARAKLNVMKDNESWNTSWTKDYYTDLTDIAREYLKGQFKIDATEMTSEEIMKAVNKLNFSISTKEHLQETLATADFVKFAKATTTKEQNRQSFNDINGFVEESYNYFQEEKKKEEETK